MEFERAVIIRMGRLVSGGAKGPGLFFYSPCLDEIKVVDQRTISLDIPPQEVSLLFFLKTQGHTFDDNHRVDLYHDSHHITLVRIDVNLCGESAGLFLGNFVCQKNGFNLKL